MLSCANGTSVDAVAGSAARRLDANFPGERMASIHPTLMEAKEGGDVVSSQGS